MSRMSLLEWVGLIIVLMLLIDYFQNNRDWFGSSDKQDKPSISKKSAQ